MPVLLGLAIVALMGLVGCASIRIAPSAGTGQTLTYHAGEPRLTSVKLYIVALQVKSTVLESGNPADFVLAVFNRGSAPVDVSTENVTATWNGAPLSVYSFEELMAAEQRRHSIQRIGLALQAFSAGVSGGRSTTYETGAFDARYQGQTTGAGTISGTYTGTRDTYDPTAAAIAQQSVNAQIRSFQAESTATVGLMERTLFRRHTVAPNTAYAGTVRIMMPSGIDKTERVLITVTISGDTHTFALDLKPM